MLLMTMMNMSGCSLLPTKIVYVKPEKVSFVVPTVEAEEVSSFKPQDIEVVNKTRIETSVNTFLKIQEITKKLRVQVKMYKEAFFSLERQIKNYNQKVKEQR